MNRNDILTEKTVCYHCGETCDDSPILTDNRHFCCTGCKLVYELLNENNLCTYYNLNHHPGVSPKQVYDHKFDYLDVPEITQQLIRFSHNGQAHVTFYLPGMHCSSCIWLLEHMHRIMPAIVQSTVNFQRKEISLVYKENETALAAIAHQLTVIGYEPHITLSDLEKRKPRVADKSHVIKIAVAGFCFGNIMMMSFPEYFGLEAMWQQQTLQWFFRYLNLMLALPVLLYSASGFFTSAWKSIRQRYLNIDAPIALAIAVTFLRSLYEVLSNTGSGYFDSMTGIVFFMLIGRYVQNRTYDTLSFERDYKSFFPMAVRVIHKGTEQSRKIADLKPGDQIVIRNQELIPADARLLCTSTHIDYSFVSGESSPVARHMGDLVYAGGRQLEGAITLEVTRSVSQSYLTQLWNGKPRHQNPGKHLPSFVDPINRYFTMAVLIIAAASGVYWLFADPSKALNAISAVLIVACPCGLLLTSSFTNGSIIRLMGRMGCYLKNASAIEAMATTDTLVFDKTGTITHGSQVTFKGTLTPHELAMAVSLAAQSAHVLSRKISGQFEKTKRLPVTDFIEYTGKGLCGTVDDQYVMMGSERFIVGWAEQPAGTNSRVYVSIDGHVRGFFSISSTYRDRLHHTISELKREFSLHMLSGDHPVERAYLEQIFPPDELHFNQTPEDKLNYICKLQAQGHRVIMIGDGLNDAHAFNQSNMAIAVSDDASQFSPACDAILDGVAFKKLPALLHIARKGRRIIAACFAFSLVYNIAGLLFAVQGTLSPVVAAILMPASSVSIVLISTLSVYAVGKRAARKI